MLRIPSTAVVRHFLMVPTRQFAQKTKFTAQLPDMLEKISNEKLYFIKDVKNPAPKILCPETIEVKFKEADEAKVSEEEVLKAYEEHKESFLKELIGKLRAKIWSREKSFQQGENEENFDKAKQKLGDLGVKINQLMVKSQGSDIVQRGRYYLNAFPFTSYYSYMEGLSIAAFKEVHQFYVKVANSITTFIRSPEYIVFQDTSLKMMIAFYKSTKAFLISAFYFLKECYWDHSYYSRKDKIKRD